MSQDEKYILGRQVSFIAIFCNIGLSALKLIIGIVARSSAMVADSIHSLSDVISTFIVIIALKISQKPEDKEHPYGHEKFEPILAKILALILGITAILLGYNGVKLIISGEIATPGRIAILAAIISIATKEWMYRYTINVAKTIDSTSLKADAWHHRTDAFSSIGTLIGIIGARLGIKILDPIASLIICVLILKVAFEIYVQAINQLIDHSVDDNMLNSIKEDILSVNGIIKIDDLKTRVHGNRIFIDLDICVDRNLSLCQAHEIAEKIHLQLEQNFDAVKHCMVHVNPSEKSII